VAEGTRMRLGVFAACFSLLVEEDYYSVSAVRGAVEEEERQQYDEVVELAITTLRFLNWSRSLVPTTVINMSGTNKKRKKFGKHPLSSPTVITIEASLQTVRVLRTGGTHESPLYHAVAGHLRRIPPSHPLMGVARRGENYEAILEIEPHFRGDRSRGQKLVPNGVVRVA
jgi:hypothetical protein